MTTPRTSDECSLAEMARRLCITKQAAGLWAKRPGAPVRVDGARVWVRPADFQRWREQELCRQAVLDATKAYRDRDEATGRGDPALRKLTAEARRSEIEVELLEHSVVRVDEASAMVEEVFTGLRAVLLAFPRVAAPQLVGARTLAAMEHALNTQTVRLLERLSAPTIGEPTTRDEAAS